MDDERNIWAYVRELESRIRKLEGDNAVLWAWYQGAQARSNYLPSWVIGVIGILVSVISVAFSMWVTGRTP